MRAQLLSFLGYLAGSWLVLVLLFRLARSRKYFFHLVPFVIAYAVSAGVLLKYLRLQNFFWWYLTTSSVCLAILLTRHLRSPSGLAAFAQLQRSALQPMPDGNIRDELERELSPGRQTTQHAVGSVLVFIVSFTLAFYIVNRSP
jgi:hypothetical protein